MITCNLMGGLGNQIFQIFATINYAIKNKKQFGFLNVKTLGENYTTIRYTFWETFFSKLQPFLKNNFSTGYQINEKQFSYDELPDIRMIKENILLYGYFQSYKYFQENYALICRIICLDKMKEDLLIKLKFNKEELKNVISMHFRIGDYKLAPHYHPLATHLYYVRALECISNKQPLSSESHKVIYFCEDTDIDDVMKIINSLEQKFTNYKFIRCDNNLADWEQMLLMSCCNHNIIANSSFSWWGAYFNSAEDKIVCYPSIWFGTHAQHDTRDLCPPTWIKIKV
jgi:hypothetical protein